MTMFDKIRNRTVQLNDQYLIDESKLAGGNAEKVFFPENTAEIVEIVSYCKKFKIPFTVYGKGTGITGGSVPFGGFVISLEKLNKIRQVGYDAVKQKFYLNVETAVTLTEIKEFLQKKEYYDLSQYELTYPVDPTEMSASIGGTVATNASGASSFRYGPTRNYIKSIEVVLPDGEIATISRGEQFANDSGYLEINRRKFQIPEIIMPECKNAAGMYSAPNMDLIDIFIGSEGILGIITSIDIWLERKYPSISVIKFLQSEKKAFEFVNALKTHINMRPVFVEYIDERGLDMLRNKRTSDCASINIPEIKKHFKTAVFFDVLLDRFDIIEACGQIKEVEKAINAVDSDSWCSWEKIEIERIRSFRHAMPETVNTYIAEVKKEFPGIHKLGTDMAVPEDKFQILVDFYHDILVKSGLKYVVFGHIGDNHLHINILPKNEDQLKKGFDVYKVLAKKAVELKGTVSAEHGIGKIKRQYLLAMYGEKGINEMKRVKAFFDPEFLLNRNNMFEYGETK